jgi:hypothetical protein
MQIFNTFEINQINIMLQIKCKYILKYTQKQILKKLKVKRFIILKVINENVSKLCKTLNLFDFLSLISQKTSIIYQ